MCRFGFRFRVTLVLAVPLCPLRNYMYLRKVEWWYIKIIALCCLVSLSLYIYNISLYLYFLCLTLSEFYFSIFLLFSFSLASSILLILFYFILFFCENKKETNNIKQHQKYLLLKTHTQIRQTTSLSFSLLLVCAY